MFELQTFGGLQLRRPDGSRAESALAQSKGMALLVYLAASAPPSSPVRRDQLLALLWPDRDDEHARNALRSTLNRLRRALDADVVGGKGQQDLWLPDERVWSDVRAFERGVEDGAPGEALRLYEGPFLEGFHVSGAAPFERWAHNRREEYRQVAYRAALAEGDSAREAHDLETAEAAFRQALDIAPNRERSVRRLLEVLAERGDRAAALQLFESFRKRLEEKLDVTPSDDLRTLAEQIRSRPPGSQRELGAGEDEPSERETSAVDRAGESGEARTDGSSSGWGRFRPVAVAAFLIAAIGAALWYGPGNAGGEGGKATGTVLESERLSVAVLPFQVSGSGADTWRDGMVTILSAGLDGAAGLRAIADQTVLAVWEEEKRSGRRPVERRMLGVARRLEADYAVIGSTVGLGAELRFVAEVRDVQSGDRLAQVEVRGAADRAPALADSLTRRVLGVILEEGGGALPSVDLASITTRSLPALKAYLAGERHFRAGEYEAAVKDYEAAVAEDSSFALSHVRLARAHAWLGEGDSRFWNRASELSDRLPARERRLVWAHRAREFQGRSLVAADSLRRLTQVYPDDPSLWYEFGELLWHASVPGGWPEAERAFERAVELDPGVAAYHNHLVDLAFSLHQDSALASQRIAAHPGGRFKPMFRAAWDLRFGSREMRQKAFARLDSLWPYRIVGGWQSGWPLLHPTSQGLQGRMLRVLEDDAKPGAHDLVLARNHLQRGQIEEALPLVRGESGEKAACLLARTLTLGYPVPDSILRPRLDPAHIPRSPSVDRLVCTGLYLIEGNRAAEINRILDRLRAKRPATGEANSQGHRVKSAVAEVEGYRAWKKSDLRKAARHWSRSNESGPAGAIWRGDLYRERGQLEKAEGWYMAAWPHPVAHERLGQLFEEMDKPERAAAAYRRFIAAWEDADRELQDRVDEARRRLVELLPAE